MEEREGGRKKGRTLRGWEEDTPEEEKKETGERMQAGGKVGRRKR
jgi:hypothetical protein